jgi:hypothetical protein
MDPVVPQEITAELTQILSNLVLGDNEIRSKYVFSRVPVINNVSSSCDETSAEKAVNDRLTHTPELYLLALAQFSITADTEVVCRMNMAIGILLILVLRILRCVRFPSYFYVASFSGQLPISKIQKVLR